MLAQPASRPGYRKLLTNGSLSLAYTGNSSILRSWRTLPKAILFCRKPEDLIQRQRLRHSLTKENFTRYDGLPERATLMTPRSKEKKFASLPNYIYIFPDLFPM